MKDDEGNSICGALFPAVTIAFGIQLVRSLSLFVVLWQVSFEQCHMLEGLFSDNLSVAITICCTRSPGPAIEPLP